MIFSGIGGVWRENAEERQKAEGENEYRRGEIKTRGKTKNRWAMVDCLGELHYL